MDVKFILFLRHNYWNICAKSEIFTISGLGVWQGCGKVTKITPFCHKMRRIKILDSFYGNPTRNKKVRGKKYFNRIP